MVVCLMRISAKSRKLIGIFNGALIGFILFLEVLLVILKNDKLIEFYNIGIFQWLRDQDSVYLYSNFIVSFLVLCSVCLLIFVFDVATSQESEAFHVNLKTYSISIYLLCVSFMVCVLSYTLSLRISSEYDTKMTTILMTNYLNYNESMESRRLVDRIHIEYSCCGVNSIEDFVDLSEVDNKLPTQTKLWPCNEWEYCSVPLSCCKTVSCSQKVELLNDGWDQANITNKWFNKIGCVKKMDNAWLFFNFPSYKLNDFIMILVLGFHICSLILTQILVTSSATLHGARLETSESSYAWLIDVGQPDSVALIKKLNPDILPSEFEASTSVGKDEKEIEPEKDVDMNAQTALTTTAETEHTATMNSTTAPVTTTNTAETTDATLVSTSTSNIGKLSTSRDDGVLSSDSNDKLTKKSTEHPMKKEKQTKNKVQLRKSTETKQKPNVVAKPQKKTDTKVNTAKKNPTPVKKAPSKKNKK
ncbi:TetraSPanin family [Caenorhabditis elegans]|uniref:TetraSPanin family n=2 Tax=Caenorhabditis elegans TaxID=6239 RepID=Q21052_CAEEL|nr:TetraSPanin family [Caenorhabditis elegans]CCD70153.1 TetraSPanin family [Caenorhabditis elegans]|eukprot:NP_495178.1 TetraSPanin family [Caenorhabditis elegans]